MNDWYEAGSAVKAMTMGDALNEGRVSTETGHDDTSGKVTSSEYTIQNFDDKPNGYQTMTQVLEKSSNTGMVFVARLLGPERRLAR